MLDLVLALDLVVTAINVGVFLFGAYWALEIRKALASPLYRTRALWIAVMGALFSVFFLFLTAIGAVGITDAPQSPAATVEAAFIYAIVVTFFVWIDSTVRIARRSDPLRRNTLKWSILRWFLGFLAIVGTFFALVFNSAAPPDFSQATPLYGPIGGTLFLGAIALLLSARRSGDLVLRVHLKWFGLFAGFLWISSAVLEADAWRASVYAPAANLATHIAFAISAYFLYRSARSLAPIAPLPTTSTPSTPSAVGAQVTLASSRAYTPSSPGASREQAPGGR